MSTHKHIDRICVVITILGIIFAILFMNGSRLGLVMRVDEDAEAHSDDSYFTANDENADWSTDGATVITLTGDGADISGNGAYVYEGDVIIHSSGRYIVSGSLEGGSIIVDARSNSKVWILLDGVTITCDDDACLRVDEADKVFLTLAEGSQNSFTSGADLSDEALADGTDGAVYAHDDLTINGSGELTVTAGYKHGISANDDLVITGGTITVTAPGDAIHAHDSIRIENAVLDLTAGDDGIQADEDVEGAYIYIGSGTFTISASDEGISAPDEITIDGGSFTIAVGTGKGSHGIRSGSTCTVNGGTFLFSSCYEGIQAVWIDITGGDLTFYPTDDALNASNGSGSVMGGFLSSAASATNSELPWLHISGGTILVINENGNDADGLDSNGDILISGGEIFVSMTGTGSNSALDSGSESGGTCTITGGTVVACGSSSR